MRQVMVTPASGKRLIAKAIAKHPAVASALKNGTLVILAGTTNGYVTEEIFKEYGIVGEFSKSYFFRGIILPPGKAVTCEGRLKDESRFPGDVIITKGVWQKGKTISNVVDQLREGDLILKGANAVDLERKQAALLIGHTKAGTIAVSLQAIMGRRVRLIMPVGLEKRVCGDLYALAEKVNLPGAKGYRLFPVPGHVFTELDAISLLTGATAELIAAGGVGGAEGSCLLAVSGTVEQEEAAERLVDPLVSEPAFDF